MDVKDVIYDVIDEYFSNKIETTEQLSIKICEALNICEYCGAKLKGENYE